MTALNSRLISLTTGFGVAAGTIAANQLGRSIGTPCSAMVGSSGAACSRSFKPIAENADASGLRLRDRDDRIVEREVESRPRQDR